MITPNEYYPELGSAIGHNNLYFKREDLHPLGSHKGRSIPIMIDLYYAKGARNFAISSSGNAALAAALYIKDKPEISLDIFVGNNVSEPKLNKLQKIIKASTNPSNIKISRSERPLQSLSVAVKNGSTSLRQSTDDIALIGYESLADEISSIENISAVFIGTSSGTTAQALAAYFVKKNMSVQVHIVQTSSCHPMLEAFKKCETVENSIADAIVDITAIRKPILIPFIEKTGGTGWCVSNEEIREAQTISKKYSNLDISTNSALSVAGTIKAIRSKYIIDGAIVCMICGD